MATKYDSEYYFLLDPRDREDLPSLVGTRATAKRTLLDEPQPVDSPPLVFFNGGADYQKKRGVTVVARPPQILFNLGNLIVNGKTRDALATYAIPHMHAHPAIYVHDDRKNYKNFWYLTFTAEFDCWDRSTSFYYPEPMVIGDKELFTVARYCLNEGLLDRTPLEQRRLFRMGGTTDARTVCHASLVDIFAAAEGGGVEIVRIDRYGDE